MMLLIHSKERDKGFSLTEAIRENWICRIGQIMTPLSGCSGIGYMMKRLNDAINRGVAIPR